MHAEILKINSEKPEASLIRYAADQIRAGEVLGMPTDTFYGLAADPFNLRARFDRGYMKSSRAHRHKPLSLLIESEDQAEELARPLPDEFYKLARRFWPGPLTIIVKAASRLPLKVTANTGNVALRIPSAKIPLAVVQAAGIPNHCTDLGESERGVHGGCTDGRSGTRSTAGADCHYRGRRHVAARDHASTIIDLTDEEARWKIMRKAQCSAQDISEFFAQG